MTVIARLDRVQRGAVLHTFLQEAGLHSKLDRTIVHPPPPASSTFVMRSVEMATFLQ